MTKTAILTATELEMAPIRDAFGELFDYQVGGIGVLNTAITTLRFIELYQPDLIIQAGIAGAIDKDLQMCQAVVVEQDYLADMGAMRGGIFERFATEILTNNRKVEGLQSVRGRTVSTACAAWMVDNSQIETMEGAALMAVCATMGVECIQIRTISNYIDTPRSEWRIEKAIAALPAAISKV